MYLDVWLKPEFFVQMLTLLTSKRANANAFTEESRQALALTEKSAGSPVALALGRMQSTDLGIGRR